MASWLILISIASVVDHVALSRLTQRTQQSVQVADMAALQRRQSALEQQLALLKQRPPAVSPVELASARQATDDRMARVEHALDTRASADAFTQLEARTSQIETQLAALHQKPEPVAPRRRASPRIVTPPFALRGIELRGGEPFLSIAPSAASPLSEERLLRAGDSDGNWLLESIDGKAVTFRMNGRAYPFPVPGNTP
ncbi:hypothetical protein [Paraburkholderia ginsengisoli]|uniref:Uncharacterized protein n=1 Tax=Paraburkholderia ginsengisoli TaxID=311231 RepID=A0A7T4N361_9BURK|nr:hypothetical protein [Paraburkholderia ginsengisoli]QQC64359.1 hypothetical protein I6I06_02365 [Paraburkholderia ginsengisoli]